MSAILGRLAQVMGSQKLFETGAVYAVNVSTGPARGRTSGLASALVVDEKTEEGKACEITLRRTCKAYVAQRAEA